MYNTFAMLGKRFILQVEAYSRKDHSSVNV